MGVSLSTLDIIILPVDKGSTNVVMNKEDYILEIQLSDSNTYKPINSNPTEQYTQN